MLAGFLGAMAEFAPDCSFSGCVPFDLEPLRRRFPQIEWHPYHEATRRAAIHSADAWLGLGGSPFQAAQSRWFVDHLLEEAKTCEAAGVPMYFLGVGVQRTEEMSDNDVLRICRQARAIWTRDAASADRLKTALPGTAVAAAADLSHLFFAATPPPPPVAGRVGVVANIDYAAWPELPALVNALESLRSSQRLWLAQENRNLPGAERQLFASLPAEIRARWELRALDNSAEPLANLIASWPTPEWLVTSRYHAAIASAWAGSKVVVIGINEKLRSIAAYLGAPLIAPSATPAELVSALSQAAPPRNLSRLADAAANACRDFVRAARA